jgi:hypothetical protein
MSLVLEDLMPAFQGLVPSVITSCSADGEPNTTEISQVYYVDSGHVALSFQFFGKTNRNIEQNSQVAALVANPETLATYHLDLQFLRRETEGDLFEQMEMQLAAIASMTGMEDVFKLRGADIYEVKAITQIDG